MFCATTMVEMSTKNMAEARSSLCPIVDFAFFAIVTPALLFIVHQNFEFTHSDFRGEGRGECQIVRALRTWRQCRTHGFGFARNHIKTCRDFPGQAHVPRLACSQLTHNS